MADASSQPLTYPLPCKNGVFEFNNSEMWNETKGINKFYQQIKFVADFTEFVKQEASQLEWFKQTYTSPYLPGATIEMKVNQMTRLEVLNHLLHGASKRYWNNELCSIFAYAILIARPNSVVGKNVREMTGISDFAHFSEKHLSHVTDSATPLATDSDSALPLSAELPPTTETSSASLTASKNINAAAETMPRDSSAASSSQVNNSAAPLPSPAISDITPKQSAHPQSIALLPSSGDDVSEIGDQASENEAQAPLTTSSPARRPRGRPPKKLKSQSVGNKVLPPLTHLMSSSCPLPPRPLPAASTHHIDLTQSDEYESKVPAASFCMGGAISVGPTGDEERPPHLTTSAPVTRRPRGRPKKVQLAAVELLSVPAAFEQEQKDQLIQNEQMQERDLPIVDGGPAVAMQLEESARKAETQRKEKAAALEEFGALDARTLVQKKSDEVQESDNNSFKEGRENLQGELELLKDEQAKISDKILSTLRKLAARESEEVTAQAVMKARQQMQDTILAQKAVITQHESSIAALKRQLEDALEVQQQTKLTSEQAIQKLQDEVTQLQAKLETSSKQLTDSETSYEKQSELVEQLKVREKAANESHARAQAEAERTKVDLDQAKQELENITQKRTQEILDTEADFSQLKTALEEARSEFIKVTSDIADARARWMEDKLEQENKLDSLNQDIEKLNAKKHEVQQALLASLEKNMNEVRNSFGAPAKSSAVSLTDATKRARSPEASSLSPGSQERLAKASRSADGHTSAHQPVPPAQ